MLQKTERKELLLEEYKNLTDILFNYMRDPELMSNNERLFLPPVRSYIKLLESQEKFEQALQVSFQLFEVTKQNYGLFHKHVSVVFKLQAEIYLKVKQRKRAVNSLKTALEISRQIQDKKQISHLEKQLAEMLHG